MTSKQKMSDEDPVSEVRRIRDAHGSLTVRLPSGLLRRVCLSVVPKWCFFVKLSA